MVDSDIFRVKIDFGNFFSDHKSKAYVSVNRQWKNVRQFHRHITEIFDVKKFVLLANDGVYLHPKEHIDIIQSGDIIHVIAKKDDSESVISTGTEVMVTLTEKINTTGGTFKVPKEIISPENSINFATCDDDYADSVGTNETNSTASKRKRVRHRKRKNNSVGYDENEMNFPNIQASTITGGTPKNDTVPKSPRVKAISKCNTHVRFEDDELLSELDEEIFLPKTARVIHAEIKDVTNMNSETPRMDVETTKTNTSSKSIDVVQINGDDAEIKNAPNEKEEPALEHLAKHLETIGKYREIDNDIKEMDMIAFKVFTPNFQKSDYIIGLVESIIEHDLILQIMAGSNQIAHLNDSNEGDTESIRIQINKMDIFDGKILML
ncbi:uncharacterized protein LOC116348174 isoform X2 [Contarinia nasturtii]|uniref:uncharacterized protein LOC116348174 isoform X2 n=1 Tax=Contarinia nasturtii TaxID=265458 RepID=UPI0012D46D9A|nr:uncharacterized protein LOC116348174 isoform X2 [Contarinia nasturtii]